MINMFLNAKYTHVRNSCTCFIYYFVVSNQFTGVRRRQEMKNVMLLCKIQIKKCSNELSTKALLGQKYALIDSKSRIQIVLEWVFLQFILRNKCF